GDIQTDALSAVDLRVLTVSHAMKTAQFGAAAYGDVVIVSTAFAQCFFKRGLVEHRGGWPPLARRLTEVKPQHCVTVSGLPLIRLRWHGKVCKLLGQAQLINQSGHIRCIGHRPW